MNNDDKIALAIGGGVLFLGVVGGGVALALSGPSVAPAGPAPALPPAAPPAAQSPPAAAGGPSTYIPAPPPSAGPPALPVPPVVDLAPYLQISAQWEGKAIREMSSAYVYAVHQGVLHWIPSPQVLMAWGLMDQQVLELPTGSLNSVVIGQPLPPQPGTPIPGPDPRGLSFYTSTAAPWEGKAIRQAGSDYVYGVMQGVLHWFPDLPTLAAAGVQDAQVLSLPAGTLNNVVIGMAFQRVAGPPVGQGVPPPQPGPTGPGTPPPGQVPPPPTDGIKVDAQGNILISEKLVIYLLGIDEMTQPGIVASFQLMLNIVAQKQGAQLAQAVNSYRAQLTTWIAQRQAAGAIAAEQAAQVKAVSDAVNLTDTILTDVGTAASIAVQVGGAISGALESVPWLGQVVTMAKQIAMIIELFINAKFWHGTELMKPEATFSGWRSDGYWLGDYPMLSLTSPIFADKFAASYGAYKGNFEPLAQGAARLAVFYPFGAPLECAAQDDGSYLYSFSGRQVEVYSPKDVTANGPRGFDPAHPLNWRAAGQRVSIYDVPVPNKRMFMSADWVNKNGLSVGSARPATMEELTAIQDRPGIGGIQAVESPPLTQFDGYIATFNPFSGATKAPAWNADTLYNPGDRASVGDVNYKALTPVKKIMPGPMYYFIWQEEAANYYYVATAPAAPGK